MLFATSILFIITALISYKIIVIHGHPASGTLASNNPESMVLAANLRKHVHVLSEEIGERHFEIPDAMEQTVDYIIQEFKYAGYEVQIQEYSNGIYKNIVVELTGIKTPEEILIIGAHYDTVWLSPGADDNASGIAALIEIAKTLSNNRFDRTLRFIAFANEEQPFSRTDEMGSRVYAKSIKDVNATVVGMLSLEMLGYFSDRPGSQQYPAIVKLFYPDTADFIAFVGNLNSRTLLVNAINNYKNSKVPAYGLAAPEYFVPDIRRSDHASFWEYQYPAIMVTDTANFRNINYHSVGDTIETLDFDRMAGVVNGVTAMIKNLANTH